MRNDIKLYRVLLVTFAIFVPALNYLVLADEPDENVLKGNWILESATAFEKGVEKKPFSVDSVDFELPLKLIIRQDTVMFIRKNRTTKDAFYKAVRGSSLCIPICTGWKRVGNNLHLQWMQDLPGTQEMRTIILLYKRQ